MSQGIFCVLNTEQQSPPGWLKCSHSICNSVLPRQDLCDPPHFKNKPNWIYYSFRLTNSIACFNWCKNSAVPQEQLLCSKREQLRNCLDKLNLLLASRIKGFALLEFKKWTLNYSGYQTEQFSTPLARPLWKSNIQQHHTTDPPSAWLGSFQQLLGQRLSENKTKPVRSNVKLFHSIILILSLFNWKATTPLSAPDFGQCLRKRRLWFSSSSKAQEFTADWNPGLQMSSWLFPLAYASQNTRGNVNSVQSFPTWKADLSRNSYLRYLLVVY